MGGWHKKDGVVLGSITRNPRSGGNTRPIHVDSNTHALVTTDYSAHELHRGHIFTWNTYFTLTGSATKTIYVEVPASPTDAEYFIRWNISTSDGRITVDIYSNPTLDSTGSVPTDPPVFNRNLGSSNTNSLIVKEDPVVGTGSAGDILIKNFIGVDRSFGGGINEDIPYMIPAGASFYTLFTNVETTTTYADLILEWWEQTPKDNEV